MMITSEEQRILSAETPTVDVTKKAVTETASEEESLSGSENRSNSPQNFLAQDSNNGEKIFNPTTADILLGRGKPFQSHQGNQLMLQMVDQFRGQYLKADRKGKHMIIGQVLGFIRERGGRFLMRVDYENYWVEVKQSVSYRKVGHAFRSKARRSKPLDLNPGGAVRPTIAPSNTADDQLKLANGNLLSLLTGNGMGNPLMNPTAGTTMAPSKNIMRLQGRLPSNADVLRQGMFNEMMLGSMGNTSTPAAPLASAPSATTMGLMGPMGRYGMDELLLLEMQSRAPNASGSILDRFQGHSANQETYARQMPWP